MPEIVFEERISLLEVFKHYWLFRFNWREWNKETMGCKAVCFPRDNLQTFCLEETREYQQWQPEGSLETQEAWAPVTKKVGWRAWSKGLAQIACFSTFFFSQYYYYLLVLLPMVIVWIHLQWEQISAFSISFAISHYASWLALANCQFLCIFACFFVFCFAKMILLTEGQAPLYLFVALSNFLPSFMRLPKPVCHHDPS